MAVNFALLDAGPSIGQRFMMGQQEAQAEAERNMLRQAQMENMMAQREQRALMADERRMKMDQAARRQEFLGGLAAKMEEGGYKLDRPTLGKMLQFGMQTGEDSLIKLATEGIKALDEEDLYKRESARFGIGGAPAAAAPAMPAAAAPAAPTSMMRGDMLAGTPFAIGPMAAPAAPAMPAAAAPVNALAQGFSREQVQNMLTSPSARIRETGKALAQTLGKEATDIDIMRATGFPLTREGYAAYQATKKQPAPTTVVKLPDQEKAFEAQLGKEQAERIVKSQAAAKDAAGIIDTVKIGRDIMKSGMITGAGAEFFVNLNQALKTAGIDAGYADAAANSQAFAANMAGNVGRIIKQFGAGTGLSNADREYAEKMAGGKITLDANAIRRILDINERAARNVIRAHNKDVKNIKTNIPLTVEEPPEASASLSEQDRQALDWANKNPRDPRAAEIKKRLGM